MMKKRRRTFWPVMVLAATSTVGFAQAPAGSPVGRWRAENIRDAGVIDNLQTILEVAADGAISGTGGCNTMRGKATIFGDTIVFGPVATTRKACTPAITDQETKFFSALQDTQTWRVDPDRRKLMLRDGNGRVVVVFAQTRASP